MSNTCRFCKTPLKHVVADLGLSPISNEFRLADGIDQQPQVFYPLKALVCDACWLVQLTEVQTPPHFDADYAYFSSVSRSWLEHAKTYANAMIDRLGLDQKSQVLELASNDGYLLQYFKQAGVNVLGVEPSANVAQHAKTEHGIESIVAFFGHALGCKLQQQGVTANLIIGNNVLAHVPDINDFVSAVPLVLAADGSVTFEFPHLLQMLSLGQFDTIYHEHFSYLSLLAVEQIFARHGLTVYGAEELPTHGGSLRVYACHTGHDIHDAALAACRDKIRADEAAFGLHSVASYARFAAMARARKQELLSFLITAKQDGKTVLGYGAPAKGNTLLNYCGIGPELLPYTTDMSRQKQGKYLPGVNIPVHDPDILIADRPDYVLILPWNLKAEISAQLAEIRDWGGKFVVAIPELEIF